LLFPVGKGSRQELTALARGVHEAGQLIVMRNAPLAYSEYRMDSFPWIKDFCSDSERGARGMRAGRRMPGTSRLSFEGCGDWSGGKERLTRQRVTEG